MKALDGRAAGKQWWYEAGALQRASPASSAAPDVLHPGVTCDGSGECPLRGVRYHKIGKNYDLNAAEFAKLSPAEQLAYEVIERPGAAPIAITTWTKGPATFFDVTPSGNSTASKFPFSSYFKSRRAQSIYLASDFARAGVQAPHRRITSIQLKADQHPGRTLCNFRVEYALTSDLSMDGWQSTTPCYGPKDLSTSDLAPAGEWTTFTLDSPIMWDGTSNLVMQYSFDGNDGTSAIGATAAVECGSTRSVHYATDDGSYSHPFGGSKDGNTEAVQCLKLGFGRGGGAVRVLLSPSPRHGI